LGGGEEELSTTRRLPVHSLYTYSVYPWGVQSCHSEKSPARPMRVRRCSFGQYIEVDASAEQ
jgi:hypothetical protein